VYGKLRTFSGSGEDLVEEGSGSEKDAFAKEGEVGAAVAHSFDQLGSGVLSFDLPGTPLGG
jgi:hypothetical protein